MNLTAIRVSVREEIARILLESFDKRLGEDLGFFDLLILPIKLVEVIFRLIYSAVYAVARHLGDFGFIFMLPLRVASVFVFALTSPWRTIVKPISAYIRRYKDDPHYLFWAGVVFLSMAFVVSIVLLSMLSGGLSLAFFPSFLSTLFAGNLWAGVQFFLVNFAFMVLLVAAFTGLDVLLSYIGNADVPTVWAGLAVLVMAALVVLFLASIFTAGGVLPLFAFLGPIASWVGSGLGAVVSILGGGLFAQVVVGLSAVLFASALLVRLLTPLSFLEALFMGESEPNASENPVSCLHSLDGINGNDKGYLDKALTRGRGEAVTPLKSPEGGEKKSGQQQVETEEHRAEYKTMLETLTADHERFLGAIRDFIDHKLSASSVDSSLAAEARNLRGFFQIKADKYYRMIYGYVGYLTANELHDNEKEEDTRKELFKNVFAAEFSDDEEGEFGVIFKRPATLLEGVYPRYFKFDEQLKTLYQLLALKHLILARKDSPSVICFSFDELHAEYQKLHDKVDQFHDAVAQLKGEGQVGGDAKESCQGEVLADAAILPQFSVDSAVSSAQGPGERVALRNVLQKSFFNPLVYFAHEEVRRMFCGHPLQVQPRRISGRGEWESISLLERAFYFLLGGDVVAYLKYAHYLLMDCAYAFSQFMGKYFSPRADASPFSREFLEDISSFGVGLMNLCYLVLRFVPLAIVRGLLTLPLRLVRSIALRFGAQAGNSDRGVCIWLCDQMGCGLDFVLYGLIDFFLFVFTVPAELCGFVAFVVGGGISAFIMHYIANPILVALFFDPFRAITEFSADQHIEVSPVNSSLSADRLALPGGAGDPLSFLHPNFRYDDGRVHLPGSTIFVCLLSG